MQHAGWKKILRSIPADARISVGNSDYASPGEAFKRFACADLEVLIRDAAAYNCVLLGYMDRSYPIVQMVEALDGAFQRFGCSTFWSGPCAKAMSPVFLSSQPLRRPHL